MTDQISKETLGGISIARSFVALSWPTASCNQSKSTKSALRFQLDNEFQVKAPT